MTYYPLPAQNGSTYTLDNQNVGVLLKEDGDSLLTEAGLEILLENPSQTMNLPSQNSSSYTLPSQH